MLLLDWLERSGRGVRDDRFFNHWKYIGCSKPSCLICWYWFGAHPGRIQIRPTHHNIYPAWRMSDQYNCLVPNNGDWEGMDHARAAAIAQDLETQRDKITEEVRERMRELCKQLLRDKQSTWKRFDTETSSDKPSCWLSSISSGQGPCMWADVMRASSGAGATLGTSLQAGRQLDTAAISTTPTCAASGSDWAMSSHSSDASSPRGLSSLPVDDSPASSSRDVQLRFMGLSFEAGSSPSRLSNGTMSRSSKHSVLESTDVTDITDSGEWSDEDDIDGGGVLIYQGRSDHSGFRGS